VIAVAVVAQLLMVWEAAHAAPATATEVPLEQD
jgi:xanthine dehydrogenase accessory factor